MFSPLGHTEQIDINRLALPTDVKDIGKSPGAIYYSPSIKGKTLMPVHIWGNVGKSGLHFVPMDTTIIEGLSFAGGAQKDSILKDVKLTRKNNDQIQTYSFNLERGGDNSSQLEKLKPGDIVYVEQSNFYANRAYYTGLVGVFATVLSSVLLWRQLKKN